MKPVLSIASVGALGALMLAAVPAQGQSYGGAYGAGYDYSQGAYAYGGAYAGHDRSYGHDRRGSYDRGYDRGGGDYRDHRRHTRYDPPQRPAPYTSYNAHGMNSAHVTGYSYGYGGVGYPYARTRSYSYTYSQPTHGYGQYGYDRGGRYGYSRSFSHDQRQPGYRDRYGYHDDRPPVRHRAQYRYGNDYRYDRDCYCQDVYLYDR